MDTAEMECEIWISQNRTFFSEKLSYLDSDQVNGGSRDF